MWKLPPLLWVRSARHLKNYWYSLTFSAKRHATIHTKNSKRDANPLGGNSATQEILLGIRNHHGSKHFGEFLPISWRFLVKNHSASRTFDLCWVSKALFCWIFPFFGARKGHFLKNWGMKIGGFWQPIGWEELLQHLSCISSTKPKAKHYPNNSLF